MAVTAKLYGKAVLSAFAKGVDWVNDSIKVALCTASYTPDQDADDFFDDCRADEVSESGTNYTADGVLLASKTSTYSSGTNTHKLDAADLEWTNATMTCRYAVFYKNTGVDSTSPLLMYMDFEANQSVSGETFQLVLDATHGLLELTAGA